MPRCRPRQDGVTDTIYLDNASSITISGTLPWPDGKAFEIIDNLGRASPTAPITIIAPTQGQSFVLLQIPDASITLKWGDRQFNLL